MQLQSACDLIEGKSFGGRRTFATDKAMLMSTLVRLIGSLRANLDKKMISQAESGYADLKSEFKDSLFGILGSFQKEEITAATLETMWRSEIKGAWEKAYLFGVRSVGNPFGIWEEDKSWLKGAEAEEYGYLGKFVDDIEANALTMGIEDRLGMYSETLDGVFNHGKIDGSPEFVEITWLLREAKHCDDCIRFAAGSPYTKKTLPAVPRDGTSKCLSYCRCELRFEYAEGKPKPEVYTIKGPKAMVAPAGFRLPSGVERDKLGQMSAEVDRLRGLIGISKGDVKKELIQQRRDLNAELIDYMEKHKVYYVPFGQVQKVRFIESLAEDASKLLFEGGPGSGHFGHKGRPGMRGGSLPGGSVAAHGEVRSSQMATWLKSEVIGKGVKLNPGEASTLLRSQFPGQPDERYVRAVLKAGLVLAEPISKPKMEVSSAGDMSRVTAYFEKKRILISGDDKDKEHIIATLARVPQTNLEDSGLRSITVMKSYKELNELYRMRAGDQAKLSMCDGFYDRNGGDMALGPRPISNTILHEFGHSLLKRRVWMSAVWAYNASQGKVTRYGATDKKEGFAEAYSMYVLNKERLRRRAPKIFEVMEKKVFV